MLSTRLRAEFRETARLAAPLVLGQLSAIGMNVVDTLLAGHYNAATLAAVAVGTSIWSLAIVTAIGVMLALPPSVAQLAGAGERERIGAAELSDLGAAGIRAGGSAPAARR